MLERSMVERVITLRLNHGRANALDLDLLEALRAELDAVTNPQPPHAAPAATRPAVERPTVAGSAVERPTAGSPAAESPAAERPTAGGPAADRPAAIILTGTGTIFSAGVDLLRLSAGGPDYIRRFFPLLSDVLSKLFTIEVPVVAALNGHAVAGGCLLAFACDYRLMADGGHRIGLPELSVGLPFPAVGHEIVRFAAPGHRVQSLVYTGTTLLPGEALAAGFLDEVVPPEALDVRARAVAVQLGRMQPEVFAHTKRFLRSEAIDRLARRGREADRDAILLWLSDAARERVRSYLAQVLGK